MTDETLALNKTKELSLGQLYLEVEALKSSTNALIKTVDVLDANSGEIQKFIDETQSRFDTVDQLLEQRALDKEAVFAALAKLDPEQLMMAIRNSRSLMNDRWIMHKCAKVSENNEIELLPPEQSMIFPFIPVSVSSLPVTAIVEGSDEVIQLREKKISYGLTSFGYDVTLAPEFKIFTPTPANGAPYPLIDPKNFDESCYIHATGDSYIIPPNSFMLARTNEFIRMPEDTVAICFNKCLTGDTRILNTKTGEYTPISEWMTDASVASLHGHSKLKSSKASAVIYNGRKKIYKLTTKMGLQIRATATHPFKKFFDWVPLKNLNIGDRIAVARNLPYFGSTELAIKELELLALMLTEGQCYTPGSSPVFTNTDDTLIAMFKSAVTYMGWKVSKKSNFSYAIVNKHGRGGSATFNAASTWLKSYGQNVLSGEKCIPNKLFTLTKPLLARFLSVLFSGDGGIYEVNGNSYIAYRSKSIRLIEDLHHLLLRFGIFARIERSEYPALWITDTRSVELFANEIGFACHRKQSFAMSVSKLLHGKQHTSRMDTLPNEALEFINQKLVSIGKKRIRWTKQSISDNLINKTLAGAAHKDLNDLINRDIYWDTVQSIEDTGEYEEVFDITVNDTHNFVANDIIVHNSTYARCGIMVSTTVLEPGWTGELVLEISNITSVPAKVYANEGIAQLMFFRGERPAVAYSDRSPMGGKYQNQRGIQVPLT